jgi:DNA polymerase IIIc chi subunit
MKHSEWAKRQAENKNHVLAWLADNPGFHQVGVIINGVKESTGVALGMTAMVEILKELAEAGQIAKSMKNPGFTHSRSIYASLQESGDNND